MRYPRFSLAVILALLFSSFVIAAPMSSGKGEHSNKNSNHGGSVKGQHSVGTGPGAKLDTHELMQNLEKAGISKAQAKVIVEAVNNHFNGHNTATKLDVSELTQMLDKIGIPKDETKVAVGVIEETQK